MLYMLNKVKYGCEILEAESSFDFSDVLNHNRIQYCSVCFISEAVKISYQSYRKISRYEFSVIYVFNDVPILS